MSFRTFSGDTARPQAVLRCLRAAGFHVSGAQPTQRTTLDSFDGRLRQRGLRLEVDGGADPILVLSSSNSAPAQVAISSVPRFAAEVVPGPLRERLASALDVRALLPQVSMTAIRRHADRRNRAGKTTTRATVYENLMLAGNGANRPVWAVEVETLTGYETSSRDVHDLLSSMGLQGRDGDVVDLLLAASAPGETHYDGSPAVVFPPGERSLAGYRRVLCRLTDMIQANWAGTVDDIDPEFLHDLRVAVRRTRSILGAARNVMAETQRATYREGFAWLGAATGPARDLAVLALEWPTYVAPLDDEARALVESVPVHIEARRREAHADVVDALRSSRYRDLIDGWRRLLDDEAEGVGGRHADRPLTDVAGRRIRRAHERVLVGGRAIDDTSPADALHQVRKDAKKLRYLLECFGRLYDRSSVAPFVRELKALQDTLGEFNDTAVHAQQLQSLADDIHGRGLLGADGLLVIGRVAERLQQRHASARAEFDARWATFDAKTTRRALRDLVRSSPDR
jgi:CHAD domain-containing protein